MLAKRAGERRAGPGAEADADEILALDLTALRTELGMTPLLPPMFRCHHLVSPNT